MGHYELFYEGESKNTCFGEKYMPTVLKQNNAITCKISK
jgi:hypothetical protein